MAKKPSKKSSYVIVASNVLPATVIPGTNVVAEASYRNDRHPDGPGSSDGEPGVQDAQQVKAFGDAQLVLH